MRLLTAHSVENDPESAPAVGRPHKRVHWRLPTSKRSRPGVLDATRAELVRGIEGREGSLWMRIERNAIVAGYAIDCALHRERSFRSDGAESLLALSVALLYLADVRSGFIGRPRPEGGSWHRYKLRDLAQLAFGGQTPADIRRARRALDVMVSLGWAYPTKQVRRYAGAEKYRSEPAVRRLNMTRICEMTGTGWLLKRDRMHAESTRGPGTAAFEDTKRGRNKHRPQRPSVGTVGDAARTVRRATADPPPRRAPGAQHIADILALLK